jgi:small multidrug resistance pump
MAWILLAAAIASEVCGTLGLRAIADAPRPWAIALITISYAASFFFMALALKELKVGVVYAIWSAVGTAAVSAAGLVFFGERLTWHGVAGMVLIVGGVVLLVGAGGAARA